MLTESLTLSVIGGGAGLAVAWAGVRVLLKFLPVGYLVPARTQYFARHTRAERSRSHNTTQRIAFGLAPALQASRPDLMQALNLRQGSPAPSPRLVGSGSYARVAPSRSLDIAFGRSRSLCPHYFRPSLTAAQE